MLTLSIETSQPTGGVALVEEGDVVVELNVALKATTYSRSLFLAIERVLELSGCRYDGLSSIACSVGPGSFTGLRIGLSAAKGMAYSLGLPIIGVPCLDVMARGVPARPGTRLCPMIDAKKRQVFTSIYEVIGQGGVNRISPFMAVRADSFFNFIEVGDCCLLFGDGVRVYRESLEASLKARKDISPDGVIFIEDPHPPRPGLLGVMAQEAMRQGENRWLKDPFVLEPLYIRPSDAEIKREGMDPTIFTGTY